MAVPTEEKQATPNYAVNYDDPRFDKVESEENQALTEIEQTYDGMVEASDEYFEKQIDATEKWEDKQTQFQQEQTDFAVEKIQQQKDQAQKDYTKEQSGAYVDWQKQSNAYGTEAEKRATNGLTNTGFSESSQVSMYNTYQNRVAVARESLNKAMLDYDNAIKEAMLQNNAAIAEIAFQALQQKLELSLQGFQYKNQLILEQSDKKLQTKQYYDTQWQNVLDNIYKENTLAEEVRQYEKTFAEEVRQFNQSVAFEEKQALYESGWTKLSSLVMPSKEERLAMNMTESDCKQVIADAKASQSVSSGGGSGTVETVTNEAPIKKDESKEANSKEYTQYTTGKESLGGRYAIRGDEGDDNLENVSNYTPTYADAIKYMKENGVPESKIANFKTINQWSRYPNGVTYEQYIANFLKSVGL